MKLELGFIEIKDIQFSNESKVENGTLFVNADDVKAFVYEDDDVKACVKSVCFDIAKPGESVRITPVKDVIEPRVKVEGPGILIAFRYFGYGKVLQQCAAHCAFFCDFRR